MVRDLQWGKWRYLNIIREQGSERLTMGKWRYLNIIREQGG